MKRIQVQLEEQDYQTIRKIGFIENRAISDIIREATKLYLSSKKNIDQQLQTAFASPDEVEKALEESMNDFSDVYEKLAK